MEKVKKTELDDNNWREEYKASRRLFIVYKYLVRMVNKSVKKKTLANNTEPLVLIFHQVSDLNF